MRKCGFASKNRTWMVSGIDSSDNRLTINNNPNETFSLRETGTREQLFAFWKQFGAFFFNRGLTSRNEVATGNAIRSPGIPNIHRRIKRGEGWIFYLLLRISKVPWEDLSPRISRAAARWHVPLGFVRGKRDGRDPFVRGHSRYSLETMLPPPSFTVKETNSTFSNCSCQARKNEIEKISRELRNRR